jgi:hypothetical protein
MKYKNTKPKNKNYIGIRARGHITIKAKTEEEARRLFEEEIERRLTEDYPSFAERNLDGIIKKRILGVEKPIKGDTTEDSFEIKYTNVKGRSLSRWRKATPEKEEKFRKDEKKRKRKAAKK